MPKFIYEAKKGPQELIKGSIEAETSDAAISQLSEMGYFPFSVKKEEEIGNSKLKGIPLLRLGPQRVKARDLSIFARQLSDLLESGLTLFKALDVIHKQVENKRLKEVIRDIHSCLKDGQTLSEALSKHPDVFSSLYVSMVKSGEIGGMLEKVLTRLSDFAEKEEELRAKIRAALAYPLLMSLVGLMAIFVLLTFVIPRLVTMFEDMGQTLPLPTRMLVQTSHLLTDYWWLIGAIVLLIFFVVKRVKRTKEGKLTLDRFKLRMPIIGTLIKKAEISRFGITLGTLLNNGIPMLQSLKVVSETMENEVLRQEVEKVYKEVSEGERLGRSLANSSDFPAFVTNMVIVGEEGGLLERALFKVADAYNREVDRTIKVMTSLLEPTMILIMGGAVAFIVISMLLPIFQINLAVH
ncbi:MAG: type II secretion system protein GspF [Nitrospirae bacterium]|nr:type II secretion system protein GspF [Nitrospirota bacterium]